VVVCCVKNSFVAAGLGWLLAGFQLFAFDPGAGPGNIDARDNVAYVSEQYTFSDGNYARGMVYFQNGFSIEANSTVRFGIVPPVRAKGFMFDATSTVILEEPLRLGPLAGPNFSNPLVLAGTFMAQDSNHEAFIIVQDMDVQTNTTIYDLSPTIFFPSNTTLDLGGGRFKVNSNLFGTITPRIILGSASKRAVLTIKNALVDLLGAGELVQNEYLNSDAGPGLVFNNSVIEIAKQAVFNNMLLTFQNNCEIRNMRAIEPIPGGSLIVGAGRGTFLFDATVPGFNSYIILLGKVSLTVGPDVDMVFGNLGKRFKKQTGPFLNVYPYGGITSAAPNLDCQMLLWDASLTVSRPCTFEGGARLLIQGMCDLYSTATDPNDRILTIGGIYSNGSPLNADLDIQQSAVLNLHNITLRNSNDFSN
jgi:hypothetical protein